MPNFPIQRLRVLLFLCIALSISLPVKAADAIYTFSENLDEASGLLPLEGYLWPGVENFEDYTQHPLVSPVYGSDAGNSYINLGADEYLKLPSFTALGIDAANTFQFSFRFRMLRGPADENSMELGDLPRVLLTTSEGVRNGLGVTLRVEDEGSAMLALYVGEGSGKEGYRMALSELEAGIWNELNVSFNLSATRPRIDIGLNGATRSLILSETDRVENDILRALFSGAD